MTVRLSAARRGRSGMGCGSSLVQGGPRAPRSSRGGTTDRGRVGARASQGRLPHADMQPAAGQRLRPRGRCSLRRAVAATILIVEDEFAVARGIQYALQQEGYEVT